MGVLGHRPGGPGHVLHQPAVGVVGEGVGRDGPDGVAGGQVSGLVVAQVVLEVHRAHRPNLWTIGMRLPIPKAFEVTRIPGAAWWRFHSFRSTLRCTQRTIASS